MNSVYHREKNGGGIFVTTLPNGDEIPWRPLTMGEFIEYDNLIKSKKYPLAYIEDEIFRKCVLNEVLVKNLNKLNAGIISAVATNIISYSGPSSIDELNQHLNVNRSFAGEVLHMLVTYVCQAFPAYKLEDVYAMNYMTLMLRVAQSENKLLRTGAVAEPLTFINPDQQVQAPPQTPVVATPPPVNMAKKFQQNTVPSQKQTVITTNDVQEHTMAYTGHEKSDIELLEHQMVKDTTLIYKDYLQQAKDGKITMKTPEQRKAEYLEGIERSKEKEALLKQKKTKKEESPKEEKKPKRIPRKGRR